MTRSDTEIKEELGADGSSSGVELEDSEEEKEPFNPSEISIDTRVVSMDAIIRRLMQDKIHLAPDFQRNNIWDIKRKSQLIESLMLRIPLPMFYVAANGYGNWDVVDGLQRLTTIKEFILGDEFVKSRDQQHRGNGLRLKNLEFWREYESKTFNDLPENLKNRILETEFRFTVINPGTPKEVKFNIFKRINTGGLPLTSQEIRHALYQGESTRLLAKLVETSAFQKATSHSVDDSRMNGRELILRFLAFSIFKYEDYLKSGTMDSFLNNTMLFINKSLKQSSIKEIFSENHIVPLVNNIANLETRFRNAMLRAEKLLGEHAFRKSLPADQRRSPINKTLFETWGNILADLNPTSFEILCNNKNQLFKKYEKLLCKPEFTHIISRDAWKYAAVQQRYKEISQLVKEIIS